MGTDGCLRMAQWGRCPQPQGPRVCCPTDPETKRQSLLALWAHHACLPSHAPVLSPGCPVPRQTGHSSVGQSVLLLTGEATLLLAASQTTDPLASVTGRTSGSGLCSCCPGVQEALAGTSVKPTRSSQVWGLSPQQPPRRSTTPDPHRTGTPTDVRPLLHRTAPCPNPPGQRGQESRQKGHRCLSSRTGFTDTHHPPPS